MRLIASSLLLGFFLIISPNSSQAQEFEIGLLGGLSLYSGDLSPREFGLFFNDLNPAGGFYLRYRPASRLAFRLGAAFTRLDARDEDARGSFLGEDGRVLNFRTDLTDIGLTAEWDLFYLGDRKGNHLAPFVSGGVNVAFYNPEGNLDGVWYELQPLATEGQGLGGEMYASAPYSLSEVVFSIGGGLRWRVSDRVVIGGELSGRAVSSDYIDDVSNTRISYFDILENTGPVAAQLSHPGIGNPAEAEGLIYSRGGEFSDWYFIGGITIGIIIGESSGGRGGRSNQQGCYQF
ncbi:MAG: DUF6089 family protein [Bacteroidota bacterium]